MRKYDQRIEEFSLRARVLSSVCLTFNGEEFTSEDCEHFLGLGGINCVFGIMSKLLNYMCIWGFLCRFLKGWG